MIFIAHRVNSVAELKKLPTEYGAEIDVRDKGADLILSHDPFSDGELLEDYLVEYRHGTLIINVKSERIEHRIIPLLEAHGISDYFFLDSSVPMMYLLSKEGNTHSAVRFSEIEPIELALAMNGKAQWVWVDCFSKLPITQESYQILKNAHYKLCLVSPELQGQPEKIIPYRDFLKAHQINFDAVCTKSFNIPQWHL